MVFVLENMSELHKENICGLTKQLVRLDTVGGKIDSTFLDITSTVLSFDTHIHIPGY